MSAVEQGIASLEQAAQYSAAHDALITSAKTKLTEAELSDQAKVRAKAQTLNKLGEYKWRYRVVDEGGSPRDEAISVLEEAATLIEGYLSAHCADDPDAARTSWAPELSECLQGLAVARLIFNEDRSEDAKIAALLGRALELREGNGMKEKAAETLNSLGSLKQKQGELDEAKEYYVRSLEVRQTLGDASDGMAKEKAKALAQSLTSLGNLYVMLGDAAAGDDRAAAKQKIGHYRTALEQLMAAKEEYVKGFGREDHPKVAWALEGIAKVQTKLGNQEAAEGAVAKAVGIRRASVTTNAGTQGFMKELSAAEAQHATAVAKLKASPYDPWLGFLKEHGLSPSGEKA